MGALRRPRTGRRFVVLASLLGASCAAPPEEDVTDGVVDRPNEDGATGETDVGDSPIGPGQDSAAPVDSVAPTDTDPAEDTAPAPLPWQGGFRDATATLWSTGAFVVDTTSSTLPNTDASPLDLDGDGVDEVLIDAVTRLDGSLPGALVVLRLDPSTRDYVADEVAAASLLADNLRVLEGTLDLDGDGLTDVLSGGGRPNARPVMLAGPAGSFRAGQVHMLPVTVPIPPFAAALPADLDGDGWLDLVWGHSGCGGELGHLTALYRTGVATWTERAIEGDLGPRAHTRFVLRAPMGPDDAPLVASLGNPCRHLPEAAGLFRSDGLDDDAYPRLRVHDAVPANASYRQTPLGAGMSLHTLEPMGAAVADFDGNQRLDLLVTVSPALQVFLEEDGTDVLVDRSLDFDLQFPKRPGTTEEVAWGAAPVDLDLDGWPDLVIAQSDDAVAMGLNPATRASYVRAFWNDHGQGFVEVSAALGLDAVRGNWQTLVAKDVDGDGDVDLVVGGYGFLPRVWLNELRPAGERLSLALRGTTSDHLAMGARVEVTAPGVPVQTRVVGDAHSPSLTQAPQLDLGLGSATHATRVRVTWPTGLQQDFTQLPAGTHTLVEAPVLTLSEPDRHLPADGVSRADVHVTPRTLDGALDLTPTVDVSTLAGEATWAGPATQDAAGWHRTLVAPSTPGSSVIEVTIDGRPVRIRPRVWWD